MMPGILLTFALLGMTMPVLAQETGTRSYQNLLRKLEKPSPLLADHPEFFEPILESTHYEAPAIVTDADATSETLGSVRLHFIRRGRCTVQGSYPASPGRWQAFSTSTFTYTVSRRGS